MGYSAASNYTRHLSRQSRSSKLMTIVSFLTSQRLPHSDVRSAPKIELFIYCSNPETSRLTLSSRVSGMSEPKKQSVNEKNSSILQLTKQTLLQCILCKLYIHIRNYFYCQL